MNYSNALYFVFAKYAAKYGSALGHHVSLLTSRKFSLMTSRGNSCSVVTNDDEMMIVRFNSMVPPRCAPHPMLAEGVTYRENCKMPKHLHVFFRYQWHATSLIYKTCCLQRIHIILQNIHIILQKSFIFLCRKLDVLIINCAFTIYRKPSDSAVQSWPLIFF